MPKQKVKDRERSKPIVLVAYPVKNENQRDVFVRDLRLVGYATHLVWEVEHFCRRLDEGRYAALIIGREFRDPERPDEDGYILAIRAKETYPSMHVLMMDSNFINVEDYVSPTGVQFVPDDAIRLEIALMRIFYPERAEALCVCADRPIIPGKP